MDNSTKKPSTYIPYNNSQLQKNSTSEPRVEPDTSCSEGCDFTTESRDWTSKVIVYLKV